MQALRVTLPILLLVVAPVLGSELPFDSATPLLTTFDGASDVVVGRVDLDDTLDIVACAQDEGQVKRLRGLGGGAFSSLTLTSALDSPFTLALGDLDGDGDNDVVVGQYNNIPLPDDPPFPPEAAEVLWLRNPAVGGGSWTAFGITYLVHNGVRKVALADLDRDGDLDILLAGSNGDTGVINWMENSGDPTSGWSPHGVAGGVHEPRGLAVADLDEDGDLDVVAADMGDARVVWFENDGVPTDGWAAEDIDADYGGAVSVAVGDFDRDGIPDVVAASGSVSKVSWWAGAGATWPQVDVNSSFPGAGGVSVVDLDQDGDDDILARASSDGDIAWFENLDGAGGLWQERTVEGAILGASAAAAGDLDQDGDLDVVGATDTGDSVSWWENETIHRRFYAPEPLTVLSGLAEPRAVAVADLNSDSWLDVVGALWEGDSIQACLAFDPETNLWWENTVVDGTFDGARAVATADVNRDGRLDVIGSAVNADDIAWWENEGGWNPDWSRHTVLPTLDGAHRAAPADLDLDGDVDLVVAGYNASEIRLELNDNGLGTDWSDSLLWPLNGVFDLETGDLDHNGRPDIAASGYDGDTVLVILNNYPDPWDLATVASGVDGPRGIDLCDVNGDGDVDLVAVLRNVDQIRWYENDDLGESWTAHDVGSGAFEDGADVRCLDLDRDGDADVAAAGQAGGDVTVWFNYGNGLTWTRYLMEGSLDSSFEVDAGDLDRDGDIDLAVAAGGTSDALVWFPNVGGQFACTADDWAPSLIREGEAKVVIAFIVVHNGRVGDTSLELHHLKFWFKTATGTPLTSVQINQLAENAWLYQDTDRDGEFYPDADTLVGAYANLTLAGGVWSVALGGLPSHEVAATVAWRYFLVLEADAGAAPLVPNHIVVSMPEEDCLTRDRTYDLVLAGEPGTIVSTDPIAFGANLFADGFETGDTSRWD